MTRKPNRSPHPDDINRDDLGARLKAAREASGLTQSKLAELGAGHHRTVKKLENGEGLGRMVAYLRMMRTLGWEFRFRRASPPAEQPTLTKGGKPTYQYQGANNRTPHVPRPATYLPRI